MGQGAYGWGKRHFVKPKFHDTKEHSTFFYMIITPVQIEMVEDNSVFISNPQLEGGLNFTKWAGYCHKWGI